MDALSCYLFCCFFQRVEMGKSKIYFWDSDKKNLQNEHLLDPQKGNIKKF